MSADALKSPKYLMYFKILGLRQAEKLPSRRARGFIQRFPKVKARENAQKGRGCRQQGTARCGQTQPKGGSAMQGYTVAEVSRMAGVSIRTLHHYDAIGLLKPAQLTGAGYRLYDEASLRRLQSILLLRELEFPLKQIGALLASPDFDPQAALEEQIRLLQLRLAHTQRLIDLARSLQQGGSTIMPTDFTAFDKAEQQQYAREALERWGGTDAYKEYSQKQKAAPAGSMDAAGKQLLALLAELGGCRAGGPQSAAAQQKVAQLQAFITAHYYTCTDEILQGLGRMYTADERMRRNIDAAGGEGTAAFAGAAIEAYCAGRRAE